MTFRIELHNLINYRLLLQSIRHFIRTSALNRKNHCRNRKPPGKLTSGFQRTGKVTSYKQEENSVMIFCTTGAIQVSFLEDNLFRIRIRPDKIFPQRFSYSVDMKNSGWSKPDVHVHETSDTVQVQSTRMCVILRKEDSRITLTDIEGNTLHEETTPDRFHKAGYIRWLLRNPPDISYHGLGERATSFNLKGGRYELWNTDPSIYDRGDDPLYTNVPFLFMVHMGITTGIFFDNPHRSVLDIAYSSADTVEYHSFGNELCAYVMTGSPHEVMKQYTALTGKMKLPPIWALGYHQSRWSYYPQNRVLEVAREFRKRKLPCDVIHIDIDYMDGYRCFTWDRNRFPDPRQMIETLHEHGFKVLAMIDPGIKVDPGYYVYREGIENDAFITYPDGTRFTGPVWPGDCHFPDFSNPQVREWWGRLYKPLLDDGIDAFWNDMNEIALITFLRGTTVPDCVRHSFEGRGGDHAEIHNIYGMLMARATAEGLQNLQPDKRPLVLSRSGWAGLQRYAIHWTGDNRSTWDHLRLSVSMVLNLGLSGIAFTGPDIGGFAGNPSPELFTRWMQLGTFMPFFRNHTMKGTRDQEPWSFGTEIETICRKYLELRYRLVPYVYTAVWQAAEYGTPIARPLWFHFPKDERAYAIEDQFMFGDAFLVAPIIKKGQRKREVYLPAETDWYDYHTNMRYQGGTEISVAAPLDTMPLFVKAGSVIPLYPVQQYLGENKSTPIELIWYWSPSNEPSYLYEDDGYSMNYVRGRECRISELIPNERGKGTIVLRTIHDTFKSPNTFSHTTCIISPAEVRKVSIILE